MRKKIIVLLILNITLYSVKANTFYVATNGNDANQGTITQSWRTIQKAASTLVAGDTVYIKAGTYNERIQVQNSGTINNYIVYSNYQNDTVIIDGNGISWGGAWDGLFNIVGKNYIQLHGLIIKNADYGGIWVENSNHIIIKNNHTYNTFSSGIGIWNCSNILVSNNEIELACNDGEQECITIANSNNCNISMNNVHNNGLGTKGGEGIDIKAGSHNINVYKNEVHHLNNRLGIYADAWDAHTYNINIYQNIIHHCSETGLAVASESGGLIENVNIYNNIIYLNKYGGIELGSWSDIGYTGQKPLRHIKIINNTCYKNGKYDNGWGFGIVIDNPDAKDVLIRNNICSENSAQISIQQIDSVGSVDHNLFYGNNIASGTLFGNDSIIGNPIFTDTLNFDFHLFNNSLAIDNGSPLYAPNTDFDNNNRPSGIAFDIGAYEYNASSYINKNKNSNIDIAIYPNPVDNKLNITISNCKSKTPNLQLIDINGRIIKEDILLDNKTNLITIDRTTIKAGIYILNILIDNKIVAYKKVVFK